MPRLTQNQAAMLVEMRYRRDVTPEDVSEIPYGFVGTMQSYLESLVENGREIPNYRERLYNALASIAKRSKRGRAMLGFYDSRDGRFFADKLIDAEKEGALYVIERAAERTTAFVTKLVDACDKFYSEISGDEIEQIVEAWTPDIYERFADVKSPSYGESISSVRAMASRIIKEADENDEDSFLAVPAGYTKDKWEADVAAFKSTYIRSLKAYIQRTEELDANDAEGFFDVAGDTRDLMFNTVQNMGEALQRLSKRAKSLKLV